VLIGVMLLKFLLPAFSQWSGQQYEVLISARNFAIVVAFILIVSLVAGIYPAMCFHLSILLPH
jgi:ABC-type antimicrobial peptide transport system permease subunit